MPAHGIAVAGCTLVDVIKMISGFPAQGNLTRITSVSRATGGLVPNVALDLKTMDPNLPLSVWGAVGDDANGAFVRSVFASHGVPTDGLEVIPGTPTGFTDVMTDETSGARTFFSMEGANACFCPDAAMLDAIAARADLLHVGYILLMPALDAPDDEYGTALARVLHEARARGIKTSVDAVSRPDAAEKIRPALAETDYAIMNEIEICAAARLVPRGEDGSLDTEAVALAIDALFDCGVRDTVIVHCPEGGFFKKRGGELITCPSLDLPEGWIRGSVGAGDAFCAACLLGLSEGMSGEELLSFASAAAACNLTSPDAVGGMRSREEILKLSASLPRRAAL